MPFIYQQKLATSLHQYSKIDGRYAAATTILPIIFGTLALLPGFLILEQILNMLGHSMDDRFRDIPYPDEIKFSALGLIVAVFMPLGMIIGMFMNALVLLVFYKWEKSEVVNALVHSKYPERWLKSPEDQLKADALRAQVRRKGKYRFIMGKGVGAVGLVAFSVSTVIPAISSDSPTNYGTVFILACIWLSYGALVGWFLWVALVVKESNHDERNSP